MNFKQKATHKASSPMSVPCFDLSLPFNTQTKAGLEESQRESTGKSVAGKVATIETWSGWSIRNMIIKAWRYLV